MQEELKKVIETLRRQRVRQDDFLPVLDRVVELAGKLYEIAPSGPMQVEAGLMRARAFELQRMANSVPKFVVEDLLDQTIERLEALKMDDERP